MLALKIVYPKAELAEKFPLFRGCDDDDDNDNEDGSTGQSCEEVELL